MMRLNQVSIKPTGFPEESTSRLRKTHEDLRANRKIWRPEHAAARRADEFRHLVHLRVPPGCTNNDAATCSNNCANVAGSAVGGCKLDRDSRAIQRLARLSCIPVLVKYRRDFPASFSG